MAVAADSIRHLTRAFIGARVYQGLLFWFALAHNFKALLMDVGYANQSAQIWLTLGAVVAAATMGSYYQWRFGRVEPQRRSIRQQIIRGSIFAFILMTLFVAIIQGAMQTGARPIDFIWLLISGGTAMSLATSRVDRMGWVTPLLASGLLLATLVVPALQPYRAIGHAGMAAALVLIAIQLHRFVAQGFRHAHV